MTLSEETCFGNTSSQLWDGNSGCLAEERLVVVSGEARPLRIQVAGRDGVDSLFEPLDTVKKHLDILLLGFFRAAQTRRVQCCRVGVRIGEQRHCPWGRTMGAIWLLMIV